MIVILGCGRGMENRQITKKSHVYYRLLKGMRVYNSMVSESKIIICSGGNNEAVKMKKFLVENGVSEHRVFEEKYSKTTLENCIFTYQMLDRMIKLGMCVEELEGRDVINYITNNENYRWVDSNDVNINLVTNDYHMRRSKCIFKYFENRLSSRVKIYGHEAKNKEGIESEEIVEKWKDTENKINEIVMNQCEKLSRWYPRASDYELREC